MKFSIRFLLILTAIVALLAVVFMAPLGVSLLLYAYLMMTLPSLWICGAIYARERWRAFFIGGIVAGLFPNLMIAMWAIQSSGFLWQSSLLEYRQDSDFVPKVIWTFVFLFPGIIACSGGGLCLLMYAAFHPNLPKTTAPEDFQRERDINLNDQPTHVT